MSNKIAWSELYARRREAERAFGPIFRVPIRRRVRDVVLENVHDGDSVLEVGAGDRRYRDTLSAKRRELRYESMDIDTRTRHDHADLSQIAGVYDCVFALEVVEHLPLDDLPAWLGRLNELLREGGRLVLSTPNTFYPPAYLRDVTHRTPLCYDEMAALVALAGMRPEAIYRIHHERWPRAVLQRFVFGWLFRLIGIDFARQIALVARKPARREAEKAAGD